MPTFLCNKLGRDKGIETFEKENIKPIYKILSGKELQQELCNKLIEEADEVKEATSTKEIMDELADVLEVIDGIIKAHGIDAKELAEIKKEKREKRGGFEKGFFLESVSMEENNPKVAYLRSNADRYLEVVE